MIDLGITNNDIMQRIDGYCSSSSSSSSNSNSSGNGSSSSGRSSSNNNSSSSSSNFIPHKKYTAYVNKETIFFINIDWILSWRLQDKPNAYHAGNQQSGYVRTPTSTANRTHGLPKRPTWPPQAITNSTHQATQWWVLRTDPQEQVRTHW